MPTAGAPSFVLIEFAQRAIFVLGNRNNKSVAGQTKILWQHPKVGWKVTQSLERTPLYSANNYHTYFMIGSMVACQNVYSQNCKKVLSQS